MMFLLFPIGILLPTLVGWLTVRLVEGNVSVLQPIERWVAGFAIGTIVVPFVWFLTEITGIGNFGLLSLLLTQVLLIIGLGLLWYRRKASFAAAPTLHQDTAWQPWQKLTAALLGLWFIAKSVAAWVLLIGPAYYDDTVKNWNFRGKMYFEHKELVLQAVPGKDIGVGSYPPTVPLLKTWLASLTGGWTEWVVNAVHILWFFAALALLYFVLRRLMNSIWSLLGVYLLSSLPLYLVHGGSAYADQFLSLGIFMAVAWLFLALRNEGATRESFLRLSALATGLLVFTKNEALLLYLPVLGVFVAIVLATSFLSNREKRVTVLWYGGSVAAITVPWLVFKWMNSLTFGNAKSASGMLNLQWHGGVLQTIFLNNFFMAHWLLLPALITALLIVCRNTAFKTPLVICTGFFLAMFTAQLPLYLFTELYTEALNQTGYARGVLHIIPVAVLVSTVCLREKFRQS